MNRVAFLALTGLVAQNTALVILLKYSFRENAQQYAPSTLVLTSELMKLITCGMAVGRRSSETLTLVVRDSLSNSLLFVPSTLYVVQNNLLLFGAKRLSSLTFIVCTQTKILTTAAISRIMLRTKFSSRQIVALGCLTLGVVLVQLEEDNGKFRLAQASGSSGSEDHLLGISAVLLASLTSGAAGVTLEKVFKDSSYGRCTHHSVWTRNVQLSLISLPFAALGVILQGYERVSRNRFFYGYDLIVWSIVLLQAAGGIIIAFVMKFASNMLKCIAIALSICVCALFSVVTQGTEVSFFLCFGVCTVNASIAIYSSSKPNSMSQKSADTEHGKVITEIRS